MVKEIQSYYKISIANYSKNPPVPFNTNKKEEGVRFDLSESMFNYSRAKNRNEIKINSILFDPEKDFKITLFCSHLIHYRKAPYE